jgi:hydrogenase maturation protease
MGTLETLPKYQVLVLGVGNILRTDDGLGSMVFSLLHNAKKWPDSVGIFDVGTAMFNFLYEISCSYCVIIIDAIRAGGSPGSTYRFDKWEDVSSIHEHADSHGLLPTEIIEWARALTGYPKELIIFGVEPLDLDFGSQITVPVQSAIPVLIEKVILEIDTILGKG